jgi:hypothetical protein
VCSLICLVCAAPAAAQVEPAGNDRIFDYSDKTPVGLATGWSSASHAPTPAQCITFERQQDDTSVQQASIMSFVDRSSLLDILRVSAEVRTQAILGKLSAKTRFSREVKIESNSAQFVATAVVRNGAEYVAPGAIQNRAGKTIDLTPYYADLAATNPAAFAQACGDSFVSAIYRGADLTAVLNVVASSADEKQELASNISGSALGFSLKGEIGQKLERFKKTDQSQLSFIRHGGSGAPLPVTREDLDKAIVDLPSLAKTAGFPYQFAVRAYRELPSYPDKVSPNVEMRPLRNV